MAKKPRNLSLNLEKINDFRNIYIYIYIYIYRERERERERLVVKLLKS